MQWLWGLFSPSSKVSKKCVFVCFLTAFKIHNSVTFSDLLRLLRTHISVFIEYNAKGFTWSITAFFHKIHVKWRLCEYIQRDEYSIIIKNKQKHLKEFSYHTLLCNWPCTQREVFTFLWSVFMRGWLGWWQRTVGLSGYGNELTVI